MGPVLPIRLALGPRLAHRRGTRLINRRNGGPWAPVLPWGAGAAASARPAAQRVRPGEAAQQRVAEVDVLAGVVLALAGRVAAEAARAEALRVGLEHRVREVDRADAAGLQVVEVGRERVRQHP